MKYICMLLIVLFVKSDEYRPVFSNIKGASQIEVNYVMGARTPTDDDIDKVEAYYKKISRKGKKYEENRVCILRAIVGYYYIVFAQKNKGYGKGPMYLRKLFFHMPKNAELLLYSDFFDLCKEKNVIYGPDPDDDSKDIEMWENYHHFGMQDEGWNTWLHKKNTKISKRASKSIKRGRDSVANTSLKRTKKGK